MSNTVLRDLLKEYVIAAYTGETVHASFELPSGGFMVVTVRRQVPPSDGENVRKAMARGLNPEDADNLTAIIAETQVEVTQAFYDKVNICEDGSLSEEGRRSTQTAAASLWQVAGYLDSMFRQLVQPGSILHHEVH
jgi:hypothetical protein